jgi:hypothetical protein
MKTEPAPFIPRLLDNNPLTNYSILLDDREKGMWEEAEEGGGREGEEGRGKRKEEEPGGGKNGGAAIDFLTCPQKVGLYPKHSKRSLIHFKNVMAVI